MEGARRGTDDAVAIVACPSAQSFMAYFISKTLTRAGEAKGGEVRCAKVGESTRNSVSPHHNVGNLLYF